MPEGVEYELVEVTKVYQQGRRVVQAVRGVSLKIVSGELSPSWAPAVPASPLSCTCSAPSTRQPPVAPTSTGRILRPCPTGNVLSCEGRGSALSSSSSICCQRSPGRKRGPALAAGRQTARSRPTRIDPLPRTGRHRSPRRTLPRRKCPAAKCSASPSPAALVSEPEAILCDEPTGNLDSATSTEILKLLRSLPESGKRSVVMVTHDKTAAAYGDRLVTIRDGLVFDEVRNPKVALSAATG